MTGEIETASLTIKGT